MKNIFVWMIFIVSGSVYGEGILDTFQEAVESVRDSVKVPFTQSDENVHKVEKVRTLRTVPEKKSDEYEQSSLKGSVLNAVTNPAASKGESSLLTDRVDDVQDTVRFKEEPAKKKKIESLYTEMDDVIDTVRVNTDKPNAKEETSLLSDLVNDAKDLMGIKEEAPKKKTSFFDDTITAVKEAAGMKEAKEENSLFDDGVMGSIADMIELEEGESYGLPSVFGLNKKKEKKVFGSTVLGDTFLGDIKDSSTSFYKGFKTSGESTEFMSGIMYKSSKSYNKIFGVFDDSPLNVFDDKEESSILDVFDKGNSVLDMFD